MQKPSLRNALMVFFCVFTTTGSVYSAPSQPTDLSQNIIKNYVVVAQKKIKANWYPPIEKNKYNSGPVSLCTVVKFKILPNGQVKDVHLHKSSGSTSADSSAITAVKTAAPFPPITIAPQNKSGVDIEMQFDFNEWTVLQPSNYTFFVRFPNNAKHSKVWPPVGDEENWIAQETALYRVAALKFNVLTHLMTSSESGQKKVLKGEVQGLYNNLQHRSGGTLLSKDLVRESKVNNYQCEECKFSMRTAQGQIFEGRSIFYINDQFCYAFTALAPEGLLNSTAHFFKSVRVK